MLMKNRLFIPFEWVERLIFALITIIFLYPVWSVDFFVTGDGPCHLYNSKILLDWWQHKHTDFYKPFYFLNTNFEPNWLYNLITMPLLRYFEVGMAEQLFFTIYVLGFCLGFRFLIRQINPQAVFLSHLGMLFCYHKLLMSGFLNNSMSMMLWLWAAGWWWWCRDSKSTWVLWVTAILWLVVYAAHPMGFVFTGMTVATMIAGLAIYEYKASGLNTAIQLGWERVQRSIVTMLPTLILFFEFLFRREFKPSETTHNAVQILNDVLKVLTLTSVHNREQDLAVATGITCIVFFIGAIILRLREIQWKFSDGLLIFVLLTWYIVLFPPSSFSGGLEVALRMILLPYFAMLCWSATANFPVWAKLIASTTALVIAVGLTAARVPVHKRASDYASEVFSAKDHIKEPATILTLNYDWAGLTPDNQPIANRNWLFNHVDCYIGAAKTAVISDNYEANYFYFPVIARWQTNMYQQTDKDGVNFDHRPPCADILSYNRRTGQNIDYVLMLSYRDEFKDHEYTKSIFSQLEQGYDKVFTSAAGRVMLYKRR
jgi:hypothetical protein